MTLPFDVSPWMLWTAAGMTVCAVLTLAGNAWRTRRRRQTVVPVIKFQPLPSASAGSVSGRPVKTPAFAPPAPLAATAPADGPEQRADFRRPGNPVIVLVADAVDQRTPWSAWVVDRSRRGLRLAVERPLTVGHVYTVRPAQAPAATAWMSVEVRNCIELDGHWEVGCRFLHPPTVAVLMLFG